MALSNQSTDSDCRDQILTESQYDMVLEQMPAALTSLVAEHGSALVDDFPDVFPSVPNQFGSQNSNDSDSDGRPKRKKMKKMCDSTLNNFIPASSKIMPCLEPYPGNFNFQFNLPGNGANGRWTYSQKLKKVFIDIDKVLALQFKLNYDEVKPNTEFFVRAMPVYTQDDALREPVKRCPIHSMPENPSNHGFRYVEHVLRCEHGNTKYEKDDESQRLSCVAPLSRPQAGSDSTTLTYTFVCKTSCQQGMGRRPISVVFTLEDANCVAFGRQLLAVKICSCPKRDRQKEENHNVEEERKFEGVSTSATPNLVCTRNTESGVGHSSDDVMRDVRLPIVTESKLKNLVLEAMKSFKREKSPYDHYLSYMETSLKKLQPKVAKRLLPQLTRLIENAVELSDRGRESSPELA